MNDISIIKYPYLGYSPNLMEYFLILGYEKNFIQQEILPNYLQDPKIQYEPGIISTINSSYEIEMLDNDLILKLVFPKPPLIQSNNNLNAELPISSVIFFLNADTLLNQSKIPFHGCALIFHEIAVIQSQKIFIPKAFCIISQYPFFSFFNNLNKEILNTFKLKPEIPMEILLYNILNFVPSPINFGVNLSLFPNRDLSMYANFNANISMSSQQLSPYQKSLSTKDVYQNIFQLNGFPVLDFNLSEIFNILPMNLVVEILIFNFLEFDMLFFSKNLEILNFVMYIISTLNYPCNDSIYLWHILSVSLDDLLIPGMSKFVGKPCTTMLGINTTYDAAKIDSTKIIDSHFIVDIDNKKFFFKYRENNDDVMKTTTLHNYIKKILNDSNIQSNFLQKNIKNLCKELDVISYQVVGTGNQTQSYFNINPGSLLNSNSQTNDPNKQTSFFDSNERVRILNKNIQETFYDFILNILIVFYNNYFLNSTFDRGENNQNNNFFIHYNEDFNKFAKEEIIFYNFFKSSNKYNNYILAFIQEFKCIGLYKIPLIFSEEFIYLKRNNDEKVFKSRFFEIIESFYVGNKKTVNVNFNQFYSYYENKMKFYFYSEVKKTSQIEGAVVKVSQQGEKAKFNYEYEFIELDNDILFKYLYLINNLEDTLKESTFPSLNLIKVNEVRTVTFQEIIDCIEKNLISHRILKSENLIIFSLILMFIITRTNCNFNESISHLRDILELLDSKNFFLRKYINLILAFYNLHENEMKGLNNENSQNLMKKINYTRKMCNFIIINFLRNKNILPNEQMMTLFERFTLRNEQEENDDFNISEADLDDDNSSSGDNLEKFDLFLQYHYCRCGTKKAEYFLKMSENSVYDGDLFLDCTTCQTRETKTGLVFKFKWSNIKHMTEIFSPLKMYNLSYKMFDEYNKHFTYSMLDKEIMHKLIINLIFYCMNLGMTYKFLLKFLNL
jgi:hypothetical protein